MEIPPTTSPVHIGPGNFGYPGHFQTSMLVHEPHKPSYTFLRDRKFQIRQAAPDRLDELKSFIEENPKGCKFSKEGAAFDKNAELARIVQEKMDVIYPRLARHKFPEVYVPPTRPKSHFYPPKSYHPDSKAFAEQQSWGTAN